MEGAGHLQAPTYDLALLYLIGTTLRSGYKLKNNDVRRYAYSPDDYRMISEGMDEYCSTNRNVSRYRMEVYRLV
jgi:hypothetical protein